MEAIEFKAKIRDGLIRIPDKYRNKTGGYVKVIVLSEQKASKADFIDDLLSDPVRSQDFSPMTREEIYERV